jgi:hypothetical protein
MEKMVRDLFRHVSWGLIIVFSCMTIQTPVAAQWFAPITYKPAPKIAPVAVYNPNIYRVEDDELVCRTLEVAEAKARTLAGYWDNVLGEARVQAYLADLSSSRKAACGRDWREMELSLGRLHYTETSMVYQFGRKIGLPMPSAMAEASRVFYSLSDAVLGSIANACGGGTYNRGLIDYILNRSSKPIDFMGRPNAGTLLRSVASMSFDPKYDGDFPRAEFCPPNLNLPYGGPGGGRSPTTPPSSRNVAAAFNAIPPSTIGCYQRTGAESSCSPIATGPEAPEPAGSAEEKEKEKEMVVVEVTTEKDGDYTMTAGPVTITVADEIPNTGAAPMMTPETQSALESAGKFVAGIFAFVTGLVAGNPLGYAKAFGGAVTVMAVMVVESERFCKAADCSGFVYAPGTYMCPLFRAGAALDPVFIRSPSGGFGLTTADAFDACACNAGAHLESCTVDALTRNKCYFDPLISAGSGVSLAEDICVDTVVTDNPWLNKANTQDGYCYKLDCPPSQQPQASGGMCSCAGVSGSGPALPANWDICLAAMCPLDGAGCLCL